MKLIIIAVAISLAGLASGWCDDPTSPRREYEKQNFRIRQKVFFEVLRNIHEPLKYEEYMPYTQTWVLDDSKYTNYTEVTEFINLFETGTFLGKGEIFTIYNEAHLRQTRALFSLLYNSEDWDTYYQNLIWARENVNECMFIYVVHLTVMHVTGLQATILPALHEIYPYYFFNNDVIRSISYKKMYDPNYGFNGNGKHNVVYANYSALNPTDNYNNFYSEDRINYYTEDIGLNSYYYYFMLDYPNFLGGGKFGSMKNGRGEMYWYTHQKLLARYNLERMSNHMGTIKPLVWRFPLKTGYFSLLSYWNGLPFKSRDHNYMVNDELYNKLEWVKGWELKVRKIIEDGYYVKEDGSRVNLQLEPWREPRTVDEFDAGNMGQIDTFSRLLLSGNDYNDNKVWPSALMHFETSLRDPIFYRLYERFLDLYYSHKRSQRSYKLPELETDFKIENVTIDKLETYFEFFDSDVSNILPMASTSKYFDYGVFARQRRLNHKPFTYTMNVQSDHRGLAVIRMFLGPKLARCSDLQHYKKHFFEIDQYLVHFSTSTERDGQHTFVRNSSDFFGTVKDRPMYTELYKKIVLDQEKFVLDETEALCGFPNRLILPKGWTNGMPMQFYFIITPYTSDSFDYALLCNRISTCGIGAEDSRPDPMPMGYPLDRTIDFSYFFTKNMYLKDVLIYHNDDYQKESVPYEKLQKKD